MVMRRSSIPSGPGSPMQRELRNRFVRSVTLCAVRANHQVCEWTPVEFTFAVNRSW